MVSFNNIIGHEEIIRHLQIAMKTGKVYPFIIFLQADPDPARSFLRGLLRQRCSVNRESLNRV